MDKFIRLDRPFRAIETSQRQERDLFHRQIRSMLRHRHAFADSSISNDELPFRSHVEQGVSLIEMLFKGRNDDELKIVENGRIVFRACLKHRDFFRFKSKFDESSSPWLFEFFINGQLFEQVEVFSQEDLLDSMNLSLLRIESIDGLTRRQRQTKKRTGRLMNREPVNVESTATETTRSPQQEIRPTIDPTTKPLSSLKTRSNDENYPVSLTVASVEQEKQPIKPTEEKHQIEESVAPIEPKLADSTSCSTEEEPTLTIATTQRKVYGPPQLSAMLSMTESFDLSLLTPNECFTRPNEFDRVERTPSDDCRLEQNNAEEKDDDQKSLAQPTMSTSVDENQTRLNDFARCLSTGSTQRLSNWAQNATELLLTQLGLIREENRDRQDRPTELTPREEGNIENFVLIYLSLIRPTDDQIRRLRRSINFVKVSEDVDDCLALINNISNEKILLISSLEMAQAIYPKICDLQQFAYLYLFDRSDQEQSVEFGDGSKIRRGFSNIDELQEKINDDVNKMIRDLISYINFDVHSNSIDNGLAKAQVLSEMILDSEESETSLDELVRFARQQYRDNNEELSIIDEFEADYQAERSIWWFTRPCFVSKMLNKALRVPDVDVLFRFRRFIQNLCRQIRDESVVKEIDKDSKFCVYLGQTIQRSDFDDLMRNNSSYIYFSQFLFGTTDLSRSIEVAKSLPTQNDSFHPVVLKIDASNRAEVANRSSLRYWSDENNEVLLEMGIKCKIVKLDKERLSTDGYLFIQLEMIDFREEHLFNRLISATRNESTGNSPLIRLVKLMLSINQSNRAELFVDELFDDEAIKKDNNLQGSLATCCHLVGNDFHVKNDFKRAVHFFELSLKTFTRFIPENSVQLSPTYNNIGSMYFRLEQFDKALEYHQKALTVQIESDSPVLSSIASYTNNIGVVFLKMNKPLESIKYFGRALKILFEIRKDNYSDIASTYDNLGDAFLQQENYEQALNHYLKAVEYQHLVETKNPQAFASYNNSVANVYNKLNRYADALIHFQRALDYQKQYLPITHPAFASLFNNIGSMFYRQEQFEDALPFYLRSLEIELMTLPDNHPTIAVTYFNIATTYTGLGRFDEALSSTQKSIEQLLKTLPEDHSEVIENRAYIEVIRKKKQLKQLVLNPIT